MLVRTELLGVIAVHLDSPPDRLVHRTRVAGPRRDCTPSAHPGWEVPALPVRLFGGQHLGLPAHLAPVDERLAGISHHATLSPGSAPSRMYRTSSTASAMTLCGRCA